MLGKWATMQLSGAVLNHVLCSQLTKETTSVTNGQMELGTTFPFSSNILSFDP